MSDRRPPARTHFAAPDRLSAADVQAQAAALSRVQTLLPVLDAMPDVVMILNAQRQILFANKTLREFAAAHHCTCLEGLRPGELLECRHAATAPSGCGTGDACRTCGAVNAVLSGLAGESALRECRISTRENGALDLRIYASPFRWEGHEHVLVVATDISDLKRREVLERLFFHDILGTASGIHDLAEMITTSSAMEEQLASMLLSAAESLVHEIRSQRLLLAAESRELKVTPAPQSARTQLEQIAQLYRHHLVGRGKMIAVDSATVDFLFVADGSILQRVLGNLLKNALEASRPGDTVRLGAKAGPDFYRFWVHNPGAIPLDAQLQVFQRSFSTKGSGRGLGTYSVKLLVEVYLRGQVTFSSSPVEGTLFEVRLPVTPV